MFTNTAGRDISGKRSTRAPLASRYSVTPSIEATFSGPAARALIAPARTKPITSNGRITEPSKAYESGGVEAAADMILRFHGTKINELSVNSLKAAGHGRPRSGRTLK